MQTIPADFNAMTESEALCLTFRDTQAEIHRLHLQPGDWAWLTDGELVVGAQLAIDPYFGLVGVPSWETLVHLDTEEAGDFARVWNELQPLLLDAPERIRENAARAYQLLTIFEKTAPPEIKAIIPAGDIARRRAALLMVLGHPQLAFCEIEEAVRDRPDDPRVVVLYLELLRQTNLSRALREAEYRAGRDDTNAMVFAVCINILATEAEGRPDLELGPIVARLLEWIGRFETAEGRGSVPAATLSLVYFNAGQLALRRGDRDQAQQYLRFAAWANPADEAIARVSRLDSYDPTAKEIVRAVHSRLPAA